jgi:hypothetical protein
LSKVARLSCIKLQPQYALPVLNVRAADFSLLELRWFRRQAHTGLHVLTLFVQTTEQRAWAPTGMHRNYAGHWQRFRRLRNLFWAAFLGFAPGVVAIAWIVFKLFPAVPPNFIFVTIGCWALFFAVTGIRAFRQKMRSLRSS